MKVIPFELCIHTLLEVLESYHNTVYAIWQLQNCCTLLSIKLLMMLQQLHLQTLLPYIANCLRWKCFAVVELNFNSMENIRGWMVVLHGKAYCTGYFTETVSWYRSICKNCETFPPRTICNIQYYHIMENIGKRKNW